MLFREGVPFQSVEEHVMPQIHAEVGASSHSPTGMFEFFFVDINWHIGVNKMLKTPSMIQVQMSDNNCFDVLDIMPCGFDCGWKFFLLGILDSRKDVG
jgi:hypothetical protein